MAIYLSLVPANPGALREQHLLISHTVVGDGHV